MKRRRQHIELSDDQLLILGLLLVILVAVSMLYCVGLGSLLLRGHWEDALAPLSETEVPIEVLPVTPTVLTPPATESAPPPP